MSRSDLRLILGSTLGLLALCLTLGLFNTNPSFAMPAADGDSDSGSSSGSSDSGSGESEDDPSVGGGGGGLVAEQSSTCTELFFESYTAIKDVTVCVDTDCGGVAASGGDDSDSDSGSGHGDDDDDDGGGGGCDPFPHDELYTYSYTITNDVTSSNVLIGWELDTGIAGAIVSAGFISDGGVEPCDTILREDGSQVEWQFFGMACFSSPLQPGETSATLYITSAFAPGDVDSTIFGDGALDCPAICLGPAVETDVCPDGDNGDDDSDSDSDSGSGWWGGGDDDSDSDAQYNPPARSTRGSAPARSNRR